MNTGELLIQLIKKRNAILITGVIVALLGLVYAIKTPVTYTSKATLFPLTSSGNGSAGSSAISGVLGGLTGSTGPNSFSSDANINIIELSASRTVREEVASARLPQFQNKTVTEILVDQSNAHLFFWSKKTVMPDDSVEAAILGSLLISSDIAAKINKNGVLEINYSNTNPELVKPITELFIKVISKFYINLRTEKALADYKFTSAKLDSLNSVLQNLDSKAIGYQNTTYFTPPLKLEYRLPQDNLTADKARMMSLENNLISYKEQALWTLQKATPIIAILDHPDPPFDRSTSSATLYTILGFVLGAVIASFFAVRKALKHYLKAELNKLMQQQ